MRTYSQSAILVREEYLEQSESKGESALMISEIARERERERGRERERERKKKKKKWRPYV